MKCTENSTSKNEERHGDNGETENQYRKGGQKKTEYDPFQMRDKVNATTFAGALLHLTKSSLGSGILAMPNAFKNGGLIFGLVGTALVGLLCTHCIQLLVLCSQTLARRTRFPVLGFANTAAAAFSTGPRVFRPWASFARKFVNAALFCTYYFGNCVYVILISASFKQVVDAHLSPEWHFSIRTWILGLALPLLPLGIIRTFRLLVPFSAIATTFILLGLGFTMMWVVTGVSVFASKEAVVAAVPLPDIGSRPWIAPVTHMPLFFSTVIFAMEGIGVVLPIENSMRHPEHFLTARPCGVLNCAMILVVFLYSLAGFFGYLRFGDSTEGSITLNLPNDWFTEIIKIMVAMSIIFSYGLQFCVPSEIVWAGLKPWLEERKKNDAVKSSGDDKETANSVTVSTVTIATAISATSAVSVDKKMQGDTEQSVEPTGWEYYAMRAVMILGTFIIAAIVPNLAPVISLFGAVFFCMLGLFCPAVIHLVTFWNHSDEYGEEDANSDSDDNLKFDGNNYIVFDDMDLENGVNGRNQWNASYGEKPAYKKRMGMSWFTAVKDVFIIFASLLALVSGSYSSIIDIVTYYSSN